MVVASVQHPIRPPPQEPGGEDHNADVDGLFNMNSLDRKNATEFIGNGRVLDDLYDETRIVVEERFLLSRVLCQERRWRIGDSDIRRPYVSKCPANLPAHNSVLNSVVSRSL